MSKEKKTIEELIEVAILPEEEQPYEVATNWVWSKLGVVVVFYSGSAFPKAYQGNEDKEISFYKVGSLKEVDSKFFLNKSKDTIDEDVRKKLKAKLIPRNTILFAKIGEAIRLNRRALIGEEACIDNNIMGINAKEVILETKFLFYWSLMQDFYQYSQATAVPSIRKSTLEEVPFPLPPINEQKRIAEKVERLLSKIEEAKQLIEEAKGTFELRRAAILDKAFHGELTRKWREENQCDKLEPIEQSGNLGPFKLPHGWEWKKLGEIGELQRGKSKHRPRNDPKLFGGEYPFIQTGDVARSSDYVEDFSQTLSEFGYNQSKLFPIGTVCITIAANIADTAILKFPCCFPDSVVGFVPFEEIVSSEFVHYYISTIKNDLEHYAPATAQKNINLKILNEVLVPVPSLREHEVIMDKIKNLLDKEYEASQYLFLENSIELLKQSILSKAFRGELGTNDPSEENAIELLKEVLREQVK
ncbi:restriction endonuclease subunit S [Bacillus siamensis]|uniref:restriction endonuclease subunit S n=1 Tax=Bacillus siamensis TaxID=659243 RepID=UPI0022B78A98|nr:restriction endonuclease subunit S [Bacillus siamensis]